MRMITTIAAAAMLGITRQTIENWGKRGIIKIHNMGGRNGAHLVDADTITELGDTMADIEHARKELKREREELLATLEEERIALRDLRREMHLVTRFGHVTVNRAFYHTIIDMLLKTDTVSSREACVMHSVIEGDDLGDIAQGEHLTRMRVTQIFMKGCRKASALVKIKKRLEELESLRSENMELKRCMAVMSKDLKVQQEEERLLREKEEAERIEYIKETDSLLKLLNTPLNEFELTVRSLNCTVSIGIETVGDLCKANKIELLHARNFGRKSLAELKNFLDSKGLDFGLDVDAIYRRRIAQRMEEINNSLNTQTQ